MTDEIFTDADELLLHQLDLLQRVAGRLAAAPPETDGDAEAVEEPAGPGEGASPSVLQTGELAASAPLPAKPSQEWGLPTDPPPYPWQATALRAWETAGRRGIVKVVTGAGKTRLALMCLERLLNEDPGIRASIVVPTRVLLNQWYMELTSTLQLPESWVGRRSGEFSDEFDAGRRVMIYVINSARQTLGAPLRDDELGAHHFLIVDECHRAGSKENARVFERPRRYALGLSATPERDYEDAAEAVEGEEEVPDVIQEALGPIIYELSFGEALQEGIIPPFELIHCAVSLTAKERTDYDRFTRELDKLREDIRNDGGFAARVARGGNEFQLIKWFAKNDRGHISALARRYESVTNRRKELLYRAENRARCFQAILEAERTSDRRVMIFHERMTEVDRLYVRLIRDGVPAVLDHSALTESQRERSLDLYLRGVAPVLLSVRALIEGVNAPATDVGVIVAASASPRQKIQSIGRVLRTYPGKDMSRIYNIYVGESADESIFRQVSWERLLGAGRCEYRRWSVEGQWEPLDGPPYSPLPDENEVPEAELVLAEEYPGEYEGLDMSLDTQGNVYRDTLQDGRPVRQFTSLPGAVLKQIRALRERGGPFRVTRDLRYVLVRAQDPEGEWRTHFAGRLEAPLRWEAREADRLTLTVSKKHRGSLSLKQSQRTLYDMRSPAARKIVAAVGAASRAHGTDIHKLELAPDGGAFVRVGGDEIQVCQLEESDGFPFGKASFDALKTEVDDGS